MTGETLDLRLFPAALTAWVGALVVVRLPGAWSWWLAAVCALSALVVRWRDPTGRSGRAGGRGTGRVPGSGVRPAVWWALVVLAAVLGAGGTQQVVRSSGPLPALAADGVRAGLRGTVVGGPVELAAAWPGAPARVRVELADIEVTAPGVAVPPGRPADADPPEDAAASGRTDLLRDAGAPGDTGPSGGDDPGRDAVGVSDDGARVWRHAVGRVAVVGPGSWTAVAYGTRVAVAGPLTSGRPAERAVALLVTDDDPVRVRAPPPGHRVAAAVRADVVRQAGRLPGDAGALLAGVAVGDTSAVPEDLRDALRTSGLTHLTAVSGGHFSLVVGLVLALATTVRLPRVLRVVLVVVAMGALVVLVHPEPSVVRAAAMGLVGVSGLLLGRPARAPAALATVVVVLLVVDPWLAGELGFLLSVLATAGLVTLGAPLAERWAERCGRPLGLALALPVAAQLACAPAILLVTPTVALYAVPANLLAAPVVGPATVLGLGAGLVGAWWPAAGQVLALGAGAACWWVGAVARAAASLPSAEVSWLPGPVGGVALLVACASVARLLLRRAPASGATWRDDGGA